MPNRDTSIENLSIQKEIDEHFEAHLDSMGLTVDEVVQSDTDATVKESVATAEYYARKGSETTRDEEDHRTLWRVRFMLDNILRKIRVRTS